MAGFSLHEAFQSGRIIEAAAALSPISHTRAARAIFIVNADSSQSGAKADENIAEAAARILRLPLAVFEDLRAHGEETYPRECCGALLGRPEPAGWRIEALVRAANARTDSAHNRYEIASSELVQIAQEARSRGLEIAGFYHSHPDHPPHWSATDLAEAHWLGASYVITEVAQGKAAHTRAWLLAGTREDDKCFAAQGILVEDR
jgi:proteasome lid subunit RPN8/RPN11